MPDGGLSGEVTLSLTDQTFATVLGAIDHQAFLRFDIDANGIFHFHRDYQSLQETFVRMRAVNALLRDQLQRMGYSAPLQGMPQLPAAERPDWFAIRCASQHTEAWESARAVGADTGGRRNNLKSGSEAPAANNGASATNSHADAQGQQADGTLDSL